MKRTSIYLAIFFVFSTLKLKAQNIYAQISADSAYSMVQANINNPSFIILDIRTPNEYQPEHLENAVNLNFYNSDFDETLDTLIKTKKYLLHCRSGSRSGRAFKKMKELEFNEVYDLKGGISAWKSHSYPTTDLFKPVLMKVTQDSVLDFGNTALNTEDTINITITNFGNDTLRFNSFTDLSSTDFHTNFDIGKILTGFDDYTFQIFFKPKAYSTTENEFYINSNGGDIKYQLQGYSTPSGVDLFSKDKLIVYPNPTTGRLFIKNQGDLPIDKITVFDLSGKIIQNLGEFTGSELDLNYLKTGNYILKLSLSSTNTTTSIRVVKR